MRHPDSTGLLPSAVSTRPLIDPLLVLLGELRSLVASLTDEQYTRYPVGPVQSSLAGHVRHSLDHFRALLTAVESGELNYDQRDRESAVQRDRSAALAEIDRLAGAIDRLTPAQIGLQVGMTTLLAADAPPVRVQTHIHREISYIISHTIHHNALMATMLRLMGSTAPERFGYAPSTIQHEVRRSCAH